MPANPYPQEIAEKIDELKAKRRLPGQQRRILQILSDEAVQKASRHVFRTLNTVPEDQKTAQQLGDFFSFIEAAAAVLDEQPYGSELRDGGNAKFHFRNDELHDEITSALGHATKLEKLLPRIAPSLNPAFSIEHSRALGLTLKNLIAACSEQCFRLTARADGKAVFPDASPQAKTNNWHAWVIRRLAVLAEIHLGNRFLAFIIAIHRVLLDLEYPFDVNTAKRNIGINTTFLDSDFARDEQLPSRTTKRQRRPK